MNGILLSLPPLSSDPDTPQNLECALSRPERSEVFYYKRELIGTLIYLEAIGGGVFEISVKLVNIVLRKSYGMQDWLVKKFRLT